MIYLDNAATTFVEDEIANSFNEAVKKIPGNASSNHALGNAAFLIENKAKEQIASFFDVTKDEVIFTSGASEANNLAIKGVAFRYAKRGKKIITSQVEHPSVLEVFKQLEEYFGYQVVYLPVDEDGIVSLEALKKEMNDEVILVSIMGVNNEVGTIEPIEEIAKIVKQYPNAKVHVDATQAIGKVNIDYKNVDLISLSLHKIGGYKQAGVLIKKANVDLLPLIAGGGQQNNLRSGTTNVPLEIATSKGIRLAFNNLDAHYTYVNELRNYLVDNLSKIEGVTFNSSLKGSPYIISFTTPKKASVIAEELSNREIYVSTRSACSSKKVSSSHVLLAMNKSEHVASNSIRVSLSYRNTKEEIDIFINNLREIINTLK